MSPYPLSADLRDRPAPMVGGGAAAGRKMDASPRAGAVVTVDAPLLAPGLRRLAGRRPVMHPLDRPASARERRTLALYMGVAGRDMLQQRLLAHGRAPATTPFALVENGSRPARRVVTGRLDRLAAAAAAHAVRSPALLILGEVAALATDLAWFGDPPRGDPARPRSRSRPAGRDGVPAAVRQT